MSISFFSYLVIFILTFVGASTSTNPTQSQQAFIFHVQNQHQQPLTHKAAVYYHQQLALQEDQGDFLNLFVCF